MATFGFSALRPKDHLLKDAVPTALAKVMDMLSPLLDDKIWWVGDTALAGYYFGHRRSDDIDLFVADDAALGRAVQAVRSLVPRGLQLKNESRTPLYYHADAVFDGHAFTIDGVVDATVHRDGQAVKTGDGIWVANLDTLFAMKAATLVSRCSEKDLFDLNDMLSVLIKWDVALLICAGQMIDAGLDAETLLISVKGALLRKAACGFVLPGSGVTAEQAYQKIGALRDKLVGELLAYARAEPASPELATLKASVKDLKK